MSDAARARWVAALEWAMKHDQRSDAAIAALWAEALAKHTDWEEDADPQWDAARAAMAREEKP